MEKFYHIITYGCQMNVHESEKLAGIFESRGYIPTENQKEADLIALNTCCIRETAESHILGNLGLIKKIKETKPSLVVCVVGCMTQQSGAAERLKKRCPFVNIIAGTHNVHEVGEYLDELSIKDKKTVINVWEKETEIKENTPVKRTSGLNAWVNIMYGCNNFCSYCIVPYVRGRERSRDINTIIDDVKKLTTEGYKEITLLGQNVNSYGNDLNDKNINFANLLDSLSNIDKDFRIKFMTSHPKDFSEDVVKVIAQSDKIGKFIHLPIQAGSDKILNMMNRKYTSADYLKKVEILRKYIPSAGLSTDIMVGFPNETEQDFLDTLSVIEKVQFNNVFTFIYSRRTGTLADKMDGQIDKATKKDRIKRLIDAQFDIGKDLAEKCVGKTFRVLVESSKQNEKTADFTLSGKTDCGKLISFNSDTNLYGKFVSVKAVKSKNTNLNGELI